MKNCVVITKKEYNELLEKAERKEITVTLSHFIRMIDADWKVHYTTPQVSVAVSGKFLNFLYKTTAYLSSKFNEELSKHLPEVIQKEADARWSKRVTELETEVEYLKNRGLIARIFNK